MPRGLPLLLRERMSGVHATSSRPNATCSMGRVIATVRHHERKPCTAETSTWNRCPFRCAGRSRGRVRMGAACQRPIEEPRNCDGGECGDDGQEEGGDHEPPTLSTSENRERGPTCGGPNSQPGHHRTNETHAPPSLPPSSLQTIQSIHAREAQVPCRITNRNHPTQSERQYAAAERNRQACSQARSQSASNLTRRRVHAQPCRRTHAHQQSCRQLFRRCHRRSRLTPPA
jgi:hypothetical protein